MMAGIKEPKIARSDVWPETNFRGIFDITTRTSNAAWRLFCLTKAPLDDDRQQVPPPPEMIITCGPGSWEDLPHKFKFDCEALTRVVSKLVTNALQATSRGIVCVNLAVKTSPRKDRDRELRGISDLHLTVSDTGTGMSKTFLKDHVFRPFTKALENTQGTGLSLSICSSVMSRLGGRVHVTSEVGKGSTFDFVFPFRGKVAPSIKPTDVKVACIPLDDHETSRVSFIAFVTFLAHQFGAQYLGNVDKRPELLDEAAIVFIAGERSASEGDKEAIAAQINARRDTRQARQLLIELPNRAFVDPPNSLKSERKIVKFGDLDVIQVFRPLVLPDLELMEEIFADVLMDQEQVNRTEEGDTASPLSALEGQFGRLKVGAPGRSTPSIVISGARKPLASSSRSTRSSASVKGTDRTAGPTLKARRDFVCLVVEDNPLNARILVTLLKRVGIDYLEAKDGVEAVEQFKKHLPQVVLLDINMPRMNGFEAAIEMRKVDCPYYPRIIAVTALSMEADKLKGKECGIDDWLPKPVRLAQLAQDVKSWKDEGVWADDVPREDNSDVSEAPPKGELAQYTTAKPENPNALLYSAAGAQPTTEEKDSKTSIADASGGILC
jgi:CheY-like chemotaxis protein